MVDTSEVTTEVYGELSEFINLDVEFLNRLVLKVFSKIFYSVLFSTYTMLTWSYLMIWLDELFHNDESITLCFCFLHTSKDLSLTYVKKKWKVGGGEGTMKPKATLVIKNRHVCRFHGFRRRRFQTWYYFQRFGVKIEINFSSICSTM